MDIPSGPAGTRRCLYPLTTVYCLVFMYATCIHRYEIFENKGR